MTSPSNQGAGQQEGGGSDETAPVLSSAALAITLYLSQLRSQVVVGLQLALKCPNDEEWWALLRDHEYVDSLNALAEVLNDVRFDAAELTPQEVARAASDHYGRALEALEPIADRLEVSTQDLLAVVTNE